MKTCSDCRAEAQSVIRVLLMFCPLLTMVASFAQSTPPSPGVMTTLVPYGELYQPSSVAMDAAGNVYIADAGNNVIRKADSGGHLTIVAGVEGRSQKYDKFVPPPNGTPPPKLPGECRSTTGDYCPASMALFSGPRNLALDAQGNLYISDFSASKIRKMDLTTKIVTVYAGQLQGGWSATQIHNPEGIAFDSQGNLYVADKANNAIRKVAPPAAGQTRGVITTVAGLGPDAPGCAADGVQASSAKLTAPQDVAVDAQGNIYVADSGCRKVRRIGPDGKITTVIGSGAAKTGTPPHIEYNGPTADPLNVNLAHAIGVKVDPAGNLYISDPGFEVVWFYDASTKKVRVLAGLGADSAGGKICDASTNEFGDGCPGTQAKLNDPYRVAIDAQGNVYIPEQGSTGNPLPPFTIRVLRLAQ